MHYAHMVDGEIVEVTDVLPEPLVMEEFGWREATPEELAAKGWYSIVESERPSDTPTAIHSYSVQIVDDVPTEVWTPHSPTDEEAARLQRQAVETELTSSPQTDIDALRLAVTQIETLLNTTNADLNLRFQQNPAALLKDVLRPLVVIARKEVRVARLVLKVYDSTSETM